MTFANAVSAITAHLLAMPEFARLRTVMPQAAEWDDVALAEIIGAAGRLADEVIEPFDRAADGQGCHLRDGRVATAAGHAEAWRQYIDGGWPALEAPSDFGGLGLPLVVHSACEELFNRASPAFGMLATSARCAVRLLHQHASAELCAEWLPKLASGEWAGTICISEADAGSDVGRIRTMAAPNPDGSWSVTGEKMWISFGDHDLAPRIGHLLLARTPDAPAATRGLSLFLVPSTWEGERNGVITRRVEEKLGLHASPTCALGFENARGWLVGTLHRGLPQLFTMITGMRISVGSQGAALAGAAADLALGYAAERRQGGAAASAVPIAMHGDVRRMLLLSGARAEVARGLTLLASAVSDLAGHEPDPEARDEAGTLLAWLLPITKNFGAEAAFDNSVIAIQVLGGAGYTREWKAEQYLRDSKVLSIYEGTTGMQALDLLLRRVIGGDGAGLAAFLRQVEPELAAAHDRELAQTLAGVVDALKSASEQLRAQHADESILQAAAVPYLQLASLATTGWIALRLLKLEGPGANQAIVARARHWLRILPALAAPQIALIDLRDSLLDGFEQLA